jgi:phage tail sheath protein FI
MASYLHPGVYIEEITSCAKPIEGVSTSVAGFVGEVRRGPAGEANLIGKFDDYVKEYGNISSEEDAMGLAVQAFYLNGGGAAYICRLVGDGSDESSNTADGQGVVGGSGTANPVLTITASSEGVWGDDLYVKIDKPDQDALTFDLHVGRMEEGEFIVDERISDLTMVKDDDGYALTVVNENSALVELALGDAAEIGGSSEEYQASTVTSGEIPSDATFFTTGLTAPMVLSLNINRLGTKQITLDPSAIVLGGSDVDTDGAAVAAAIQLNVRALSTDSAYTAFTCGFSGGSNRFALSTPESGSQASIEVSDGDLAKLLRLDSSQKAALTSAALASTATLFSNKTTGILTPGFDTSLTLNIDNYGSFTITLDASAMSLAGTNAADGKTVALAIQNAVRAENASIPSYKDFTCKYGDTRQFALTSGSSNLRSSGLTVADGTLADLLGLNAADSPTLVVGRQAEQGVSNVIPSDAFLQLAGGLATSPTADDYNNFYANVLRKVRDVSIMLLPGEAWPQSGPHAIIDQTLAHCEAMANRMLIVDPPEGLELDQAATVSQLGLPTSTYTSLYYPWVDVANPFYDEDKNPSASTTLTIAPSAFAAGMWAKTDGRRGVWKAPAGVEAQLIGAADLAYNVEALEQDQLNPLGINCYRKLPNYGSVIWGSRTLATKAKPEWRYVPVRRTAIFIEQSIYNGIQWAVFELNDHPLWGALRGNIGSFMNGLFRAGAFQGATAKDAYFVRCGLGDTMTQGDIDRGQVIAIVGFAPLKPAEFVIVRIQQKVGEQ